MQKTFLNRRYTSVVRGLCMLGIVFSHTANEFPDLLERFHLTFLLSAGTIATGVFFFLSGYGLTFSMQHKTIDSEYLSKHFMRLIIPYLIFWAFYIFAFCAFKPSGVRLTWIFDFFLLKMPEADTWFFRIILCCYALYIPLTRYFKTHSTTIMSVLVLTYIIACMALGVSWWWFSTIICFPLGIIFAKHKPAKHSRLMLFILIGIFPVVWKLHFAYDIFLNVTASLIVAYASFLPINIKDKVPLLTFIGTNSLFMHFMEAIPIDIMVSEKVGFWVFISGGIALTVVLTYLGAFVQKKYFLHNIVS